jgi:SAM-dependent methyltransferase
MPRQAAPFFDAMAPGYAALEPWYEHLYAVLHDLLRHALAPPAARAGLRALDAGCGTGFQTAVLAELGYAAHGLDLSAGLLDVARRTLDAVPLVRGDVEALPYRDGVFDAVTCCGSTLSFVPDAARALRELGRVLRPGGRLLLECEGRPSLDLGWAWLSGLLGDPLGYGVAPGEVWQAARPGAGERRLRYPGYGSLRLFTVGEIGRLLRDAGLHLLRVWGIHSVTNLLPSTVLHRPQLGRLAGAVYGVLRGIDAALVASGPAARLSNSVVVLARKGG